MIKAYSGIVYIDGIRDDDHTIDVQADDGYIIGVCDICGEAVRNDDVGAIVAKEQDRYMIEDEAFDKDWIIIGNHLICPSCAERVKEIKGDINIIADEIRKLAEDVGKHRRMGFPNASIDDIVEPALLAYANMVERCGELLAKFNRTPCKQCANGEVEPNCPYYGEPGGCNSPTYQKFHNTFIEYINYILIGKLK